MVDTPTADSPAEPDISYVDMLAQKTWLGHPRQLSRLFTIEMWERLAYYGVRVVMPIYIAQADEPGGLHFTQADKGTIYAWWFIVASGVPILSGGLADRYGYKKTIALSASINIVAFILMANLRTFSGFFASVMLLSVGTALFKPALQGTLYTQKVRKHKRIDGSSL